MAIVRVIFGPDVFGDVIFDLGIFAIFVCFLISCLLKKAPATCALRNGSN
jgi:hypothetical protein